jgi:HD-GYP domain-containing protein (c-di-GMP phosphodiesterase class II)
MSPTNTRFPTTETAEVPEPAHEVDEMARPLFVLMRVLEERYRDLAHHGRSVAGYCAITARELGLDADSIERVSLAGELHDVGKVDVDAAILRKSGPLSAAEWREIRRHPLVGANLLLSSNLDDLARWVVAHHERHDGDGYPYGIEGEEIPIEARIIAVVDAYDAMRTDRVYRSAITHEDAVEELRRGAGCQFDPDVVEAFLAALERIEPARTAA